MKIWICTLAAAVALAGCSAERWAERDAEVACERKLRELLADPGAAQVPDPVVERAEGDNGFLVSWPAGHGLRVAGPDGAGRDAVASCQFGLQGHVEWIELDGERLLDPAQRVEAERERRDEALETQVIETDR